MSQPAAALVPWTVRVNCDCGETCGRWEWAKDGEAPGCAGEVLCDEVECDDGNDYYWIHFCEAHEP